MGGKRAEGGVHEATAPQATPPLRRPNAREHHARSDSWQIFRVGGPSVPILSSLCRATQQPPYRGWPPAMPGINPGPKAPRFGALSRA